MFDNGNAYGRLETLVLEEFGIIVQADNLVQVDLHALPYHDAFCLFSQEMLSFLSADSSEWPLCFPPHLKQTSLNMLQHAKFHNSRITLSGRQIKSASGTSPSSSSFGHAKVILLVARVMTNSSLKPRKEP
jgi:hypothetical protein